MNNLIKSKNKTCQLVASVTASSVHIYGQSLNDVCRFYELSIKRIKSSDLKAIERGKYALFLDNQIANFTSDESVRVLRRIVLLCDCAISTLWEMEKSGKTSYSSHLADYRKCRTKAIKRLSIG